MHAAFGLDMTKGAFGMLQAAACVFFKTQLSHTGLVGQFDRVINGGHAFDDAFEINAAFTGVKAGIAGKLDHPLAGVGDAWQCI